MLAVLLSLGAAIAYGLSDFFGGLLTRRTGVWSVAAVSQATAAVLACAWLLARSGRPDQADLFAGALAGLGSGLGNVCIYYGLAGGRMAVVAPLSALAAALLPMVVGLSLGERPGALQFVGVGVAIPAVWLVAGGASLRQVATRRDVTIGLIAGLGFGMQFSALGQVNADAGLLPLAVSQIVSVASIMIGATALSAAWFPRDSHAWFAVVPGLLAGIATIAFQFAAQTGLLTIAAVLTSLYPAVTVLMAVLVLHERLQRAQRVGLGLATIAMALIASG
jgi:uncharacterized membrane protein